MKVFLIVVVLLNNSCGLIDFIKNQDKSTPVENKAAAITSLPESVTGADATQNVNAMTEENATNPSQSAVTVVESLLPERPVKPQVIVVEQPTALSQVVKTYSTLDTLQVAQLKQQRTEAKQRYGNTQEAIGGIKYLLLLLCCKEREKNRQEVLYILGELQQQLTTSSDKIDLLAFIQLVRQLVMDLVDLKGVAQQTKEQLATKDAHIKRLEEQINALKSIEKSIHEREVGADAATGSP